MNTTTQNETAKDACRTARRQIDRLMKMLETELADREMREDTWPVAGSLGHVRELLAETVGFLKNVEGHEVLDAMRKSR